jgi:hypothetical protein
MKVYLKFGVQVLATVLAALATALFGDNHITMNEGVNILILALGSIAVLGAGNLPAGVWSYTKSIVAAATAAAVVLESALITSGVSPTEWVQIILAALGAVGVFAVRGPTVVSAAPPAAGRRV